MHESLELKPISESAVAEAIRKAEHYRLLNEPEQAESICRDVLRVKPDEPRALVTLVLALTDQFEGDGSRHVQTAREHVARIPDEYQRLYYSGLVAERQARALVARGMSRVFAYEGLREAMAFYEKAEGQRPPGNDDPILRWNSCLRTIRRERLEPRGHEPEHGLE
jgi:hypothetical protein